MKHLKYFENKKYFKVGDIVTIKDDVRNFYRKQTGEIKIENLNGVYGLYYDYGVIFNGNKEILHFMKTDIIPATPEEIEKYELEKDINKYNL